MAKKKKRSTDAKKIHLRDINSCVALVLGALPLKEMLRAKLVSKWFRESSCQALGLFTDFDYKRHGLDATCLGYLLACCRDIRIIYKKVVVRNTYDVFGALRAWRNLKELRLKATVELDRSLQGMIIPQVAALAPQLELLSLENILKGKVYLAPLSTMKNLLGLYIFDSYPIESELLGLENVLRNCPISRLGVDESCDFFPAVNACDGAVVERMVNLLLYSSDVTEEDCTTLARMPNLQHLELTSQNISNDGIQKLSSLRHLVTLKMSFDSLTPTGVSFLTRQDGFTALKKVTWMGDLPFDEEWLEVLKHSHGGLSLVQEPGM